MPLVFVAKFGAPTVGSRCPKGGASRLAPNAESTIPGRCAHALARSSWRRRARRERARGPLLQPRGRRKLSEGDPPHRTPSLERQADVIHERLRSFDRTLIQFLLEVWSCLGPPAGGDQGALPLGEGLGLCSFKEGLNLGQGGASGYVPVLTRLICAYLAWTGQALDASSLPEAVSRHVAGTGWNG